jgi:hypothetical protein
MAVTRQISGQIGKENHISIKNRSNNSNHKLKKQQIFPEERADCRLSVTAFAGTGNKQSRWRSEGIYLLLL